MGEPENTTTGPHAATLLRAAIDPLSAETSVPTSPRLPGSGSGGPRGTGEHDRIGRYQIVRAIAAGGMGVVYEAVQDEPRRTVALKVIRGGWTDESARRRFKHESQVLGRLGHPNIAQVFEAGVHEPGDGSPGVPYFAMEFVPAARTLTQHAQDRGLSVRERLGLFARVCAAIAHAHAHGIVHRDIKPSNVLVAGTADAERAETRETVVKVIDFGIARSLNPVDASMHTASGSMVGTPAYMSPEQCRGGSGVVDARSDVHALGVLLFELLTGELPYPVRTADTALIPSVILHSNPERASKFQPTLHGDIDKVIGVCLRKEPELRYPDAGALLADVERLVAGEPIGPDPSRPSQRVYFGLRRFATRHTWAALAIVVGVAVASVNWFPWRGIERRFDALMTSVLKPPSLGTAMRHVGIVALTDQTDGEALAEEAGIEGVSNDDLSTYRALYARLLDRLGESGCTVVAFDMWMRKTTPYDDALAAAATRLRSERRIETVIGVYDWTLNEAGLPAIAPKIREAVRWGVTTSGWRTDELYRVDFLVRRRGRPLMPSLALTTLASHWSLADEVVLVPGVREVEVQYVASGAGPRAGRATTRPADFVPLTSFQPYRFEEAGNEDHAGITEQDSVGVVLIPMPGDSCFTSGTHEFGEVLRADDATLRAWFQGKSILVANNRSGVDEHESPSGRSIFGVWAHAAAVESALREPPLIVRVPPEGWALGAAVAGAVVGVGLGGWLCRRARWLAAACMLAALAIVGMSVGVYMIMGMVWNPLPAIGAVCLAAVGGWAVQVLKPASARGGWPTLARG